MSEKTQIQSEQKALLIGVYLRSDEQQACEDSLEELASLAHTYGLEVIDSVPIFLRKIMVSTILGKGKLEELCALASEFEVEVVLFDDEIAPRQLRNLEKAFGLPILDRTELILEVFAQRAQTKEANLQIELAKIRYQLPRLRRMWTHLSRQAGGGSYLKGEGEKQIELDRRMLSHRMTRLSGEIEKVKGHRKTQRLSRQRQKIPIFAIVGYTNAGKSTLLEALTNAKVFIEDKLFATLDTTTRKFSLPNNQKILLVDTVGFIRKIPTSLVAAFRSTLEEAAYTDVLLHLVDASSKNAFEQAEVTLEVLKELGIKDQPIITVFNKVDRITDPVQLQKLRLTYPKNVTISAKNRQGFDELLSAMKEAIDSMRRVVFLKIPQSHYALVNKLMKEGRVDQIEYEGNDILIDAQIPTNLYKEVESFIR